MIKLFSEDKKSFLRLGIIILTAIISAVLTIICAVMIIRSVNGSKTDYEIIYSAAKEKDGLISCAKKHVDSVISDYDEKKNGYEYVTDAINKAVISVSEENGVFVIYLDDKAAFNAEIKKTEFGKKAEFTSCLIWNKETYIEAPKGASVSCNGKKLGGGSEVPYRLVSQYETSANSFRADRYNIGVVFSVPKLTAELNGVSLGEPELSGDTFAFYYPETQMKEITVVAPVGTEIIVNDVRVSEADSANRTLVPYPGLTKYETGKSEGLMAFSQYLGWFCSEPEITAVYNGEILNRRGDEYVYLIPENKIGEEYTIYAPMESTVRINGISLGTNEIVESKILYSILDGAESYVSEPLYMTKYVVSGLIFTPEITCSLSDGSSIEKYSYLSGGNITYFHKTSGKEIPSDHIKPLTSFAKAVTKYYVNAGNYLSSNYNNSISYAMKNSPAYSKLKAAYKTNYHAVAHIGINQVGDIQYTDYIDHGNGIYSCIVVYTINAKHGGVVYQYEKNIEVLYKLRGTNISVINYLFLENESDPK